MHNLQNVDVDVPLGRLVGNAGVSGSGKSSLALGVLYAEGSRRYMEALSTYTRRRINQAARAQVDEVLHVPAALALRQRPGVPGVRSTFGTSTELLNHLRLLFSRLGSHVCPNGHACPPSMDVALELETTCPTCGARFFGPGAEALAFNSEGACPSCSGTGIVRQVNMDSIVPDETLSIDEGAVAPWQQLMWSLMKDIARDMGVRTDVPWTKLTKRERDSVLHGPAEKHHLLYQNEKTGVAGEMDFTYFNAVYTVENVLSKVKDEAGLKRVAKFLSEQPCPDCGGSRLSEAVRATTVCGINLAQASSLTLDQLVEWLPEVANWVPAEMQPMAQTIVANMTEPIERLRQLGLGYLALDRASSTLSTGERQRAQLSRAVRNRTIGVLYVLDEPSIGLHPSNVDGLLGVMDDLLADGNSVVVVDHDVRLLGACEHLIEIGPASGAQGGRIVAQGTQDAVRESGVSRIAGFLDGSQKVRPRLRASQRAMFAQGAIELTTSSIHTVKPLQVRIPRGRLTVVTGVSGSGKTTMVLESLVPGLQATLEGRKLPAHVKTVSAPGVARVNLIDATPIGTNVRSTVATYSGAMDDLRRLYARTDAAKHAKLGAGAFSYNTGKLRCPTCDGTGQVSLDVQFLPDVDIQCPDCGGSRYAQEAWEVTCRLGDGGPAHEKSLPQLMAKSVDEVLDLLDGVKGAASAAAKLQVLHDLGLGYLTLGEDTPALSGGEAQRLKLASEMGRNQADALFVFDEPTIGLHPLDVEVLLGVLQHLLDAGATVVVIEHDLDVMANADYLVDMGPGGGEAGGRIVAKGTPEQVARSTRSITARYLHV